MNIRKENKYKCPYCDKIIGAILGGKRALKFMFADRYCGFCNKKFSVFVKQNDNGPYLDSRKALQNPAKEK